MACESEMHYITGHSESTYDAYSGWLVITPSYYTIDIQFPE
jgi:hypothetical protein